MFATRTRPWRRALPVLALSLGLTLAVPATLAGPARADGAPAADVTLAGLTANGRTEPLGIPGRAPSLGWTATSERRGVVQSAYQVRVATTEGDLATGALWDSGKVESDRQVDVPYGGPALDSQTRYLWQVRTWDGADAASAWSDVSWFETGMLDASDWDADWITAGDAELDRWTDYTTDLDFHLDNLAFGVFFRGATPGDAYMWQLTVADGTPRLKIHERAGGNYTVVENKDISGSISAEALTTGDHDLSITVDGGAITTDLDGTEIDSRDDDSFARGYVGLRTSAANEGMEAVTVHDVTVTAKDGDTLLDADFEDGSNPFDAGTVSDGDLVLEGDVDAWYSPADALPLLRDEFATSADKTITAARLYASARGVYELSVNGERVGDAHLAPGSTNFDKRIQSQAYDVTDLVRSGDNAIGAELGAGWYAGRNFWLPPGYFGTDTSLVAQLRIDYSDGTHQVVATDDTWSTHDGPFVQGDNIDGETYDARLEQPGFATVGFDDAAWSPVAEASDTTDLLVPQPDEPVRTTGERPALERTENPAGSFIYDLGQNMVGVSKVTLQGRAGDTVRIRYGEVLNPDGSLYTANLRSAKATDHYTFAADGTVTYEPTFTFHGFRYIEITGAAAPPALSDVTGEVWGSDLAATGSLETSDPMLNQLTSNISWGQRGNFLSIATDTPARDERLGWLGDINVFAPTASYLRDTRAFMSKFMADLRDSQQPSGALPGVAPDYGSSCCGGGTAWEDAMVTVPYAVWHAYGDTALVRENYAAMQKFLDHVRTSAGDDLIDSDRNVYGDWLNLGDDTPAGVIGTAYFAEDARMMAEMAASIGEDSDAAEYAALSDDVRAAFAEKFVQDDGTVGSNSQTSYALALGMDLVPDGQVAKVGRRYVAKIHASDDHLTTGFVGTPWLLPALSAVGATDLAYTLLENKTFPSWGYEIENGATTMWERWDSIKPDGSFGDVGMNSFNHYAYGAVGEWMYQNIGGISALEPAYKKSLIAPAVGGGLTHGRGEYSSAYGDIVSDWSLDGDDLSLAVDVPVNTTARVEVPAANAYAVTEGGALLSEADGVGDVSAADGTVTLTVGSGHYDFAVTAGNTLLGSILDRLESVRTHVGDLADAGDLSGGDADRLGTDLDSIADDVRAALLASLDGDEDATTDLQSALTSLRELRAWLADSGVDRPVRGDLDRRLGRVETELVRAVTLSMGVSVALPPLSADVLAGGTASGTVEVTNDGSTDLTGLEATVTVDGVDEGSAALASVPAGGSAQLPVTLDVPRRQAPGSYDAALELSLTRGGDSFTLSETSPEWLSVTSGLEIGEVSATMGDGDPAEHATLEVPVANTGSSDVRGRVVATLPDGWGTVPSGQVLLPAGESTTVDVPVVVPLDVVGGDTDVSVEVRRAGTRLATKDTSADFDLATPPAGDTLDHVDFGDDDSEAAHDLMASPSSGTSLEAGYTRRYSNANNPGSWYSVALDVPAGEPFVLRNIETYDGAHTKKYHVYVDDTLVKTQLVPRSESGSGIKVYDALVDDPAVLDDDGSVRVKFEYPMDASGFYDPSLADLWVLAVGEDTRAPDVSAGVTDGLVGDGGWYRSDVTVEVDAADNRDAAPHVQTGTDAGWQDYVDPVSVTGEGRHALSFRATDAAGNSSGAQTLPVWIDTTAPTTELSVTRGSGVDGSDEATLDLTASDELSGVARTVYRLDGGDWVVAGADPFTVRGYGDHQVDFASTDEAGNPEVLHHATVNLADVDEIAALVAPRVSGAAVYGARLSATPGSWNTLGLDFAFQWLRDGHVVPGATRSTYRVSGGDVHHHLSVRVTASKGERSGSAASVPTRRVAKAPSATVAKVNRTRVRAGKKVDVKVRVTAVGARAAGKVVVRVDGHRVKRQHLGHGRTHVRIRLRHPGRHHIVVRYLGSRTVARSDSAPHTVRVTRRH